ncbi:MAG: ribonuclease HII [Cyanobacteria bacterium J06621_8]
MKSGSFDPSLLADFTVPSTLIAGVDEVGRGAVFGSVVAATVVMPLSAIDDLIVLGVKDSKKLSPDKRQGLVDGIKEVSSAWGIGVASVAEIDQLNILQASLLAMRRSFDSLQVAPDICLVDGKFAIPKLNIQQKTVIKGDSRSPIIAAASILAKVWRDDLIVSLAPNYQKYNLASNKGYPTAQHLAAIKKYGITSEHRRSFKPCQLNN